MISKIYKNKKGQALRDIFTFIALSLVFVLLTGSMLYVFGVVNNELTKTDIAAGSVNFTNSSANTIGKLNTGFLNAADLIGILFLFGMVFAMVLNGYFQRNNVHRLLFMVDFIILILAYILAVYIANSWETILGTLPFADLIIENMNVTSRFLLLLPLITIITGALVMIATYMGLPRSQEEEVAGF